MEQRDYFLREIEKIGTMLKIIFNKFTGKDRVGNTILSQQLIEQTNKEIFSNIKFDIDEFVNYNETEKKDYLTKFESITPTNIELLADIIVLQANQLQSDNFNKYTHSALLMYNYCDQLEKSISFDRERKKNELK